MEMLEVCRMVARSLFAEIGPWGEKCALFGGLIPGLLVQEPTEGLAPHIGTRDVDLAIRVAAIGDEKEMYRTLKKNLRDLSLVQTSDRSFEWRRTIDGVDVIVELFVPVDDLEQAGRIQRKPIEQGGSDLTALGIYGLDYIEQDLEVIEDEGPLLDGKGTKSVTLRVCGPAVLIALKAWALKERTKGKDGYDVVWLLAAYGPDVLARRFVDKGLYATGFGYAALDHLEANFRTHEHTGPVGWVSESGFEGEDGARQARQAAGLVAEFVRLVREYGNSAPERAES